MNSATLFVVLWLANGGQQTVLQVPYPTIGECKDATEVVRTNIWVKGRWLGPVVKWVGVSCGYPPYRDIAR